VIINELEKIMAEGKAKGQIAPFIQNALKEHLQLYVLFFIYTHPEYMKNLVFTGGTCLRHFFGLPRLSEDIDFDCHGGREVSRVAGALAGDLIDFFAKRYKYTDVQAAVKQQGQQVLLKFPILKTLGLLHAGRSEILLVKVDLAENPAKSFTVETTSKSVHGFNFVARHYALPDLMSGKVHAVLTRKYFRGEQNENSVKGRDYFDLLWLMKLGVKPNGERLSQMLGEKPSLTLPEIEQRVDQKVAEFSGKHQKAFLADLEPLIENPEILKLYVKNYAEEYLRNKANSFAETVWLFVQCQKCKKDFSAGISVNKNSLGNMEIMRNQHLCPFCGYLNGISDKNQYLARPNK
jgi:hypothetical protein